MRRLWLFAAFVVVLAVSLAVVGCEKKEEEPEMPAVPSSGVLTVNFSPFTELALQRAADDLYCEHFDTAAFIVLAWASLTEALFFLPKVAFYLALTQDPTYEGDLTWRWQLGADTNNIALTAHIAGDSVDWEMRVTNSELENFLWYNGRCDFNATGGWWIFYDSHLPPDSNAVLWTAWEKNTGDSTASLVLVNINALSEGYGDTLGYNLEGTSASVWFNDAGGSRPGRWYINWDIEEYWGSIQYPEGTMGCWDDSLHCIDCDSLPTA